MSNTAIIYAPFQIHSIGNYHQVKINEAKLNSDRVVIVLPVARNISKSHPLTFEQRRDMILDMYDDIQVLPLTLTKTFKDQLENLRSINSNQEPESSITLYADAWFIEQLKQHNISWKVDYSAFEWSESFSNNVEEKDDLNQLLEQKSFCAGVIHGLNKQYPINWPTIDVAIKRQTVEGTYYLLGRKPSEQKYRFIGGYKDRQDQTYEETVYRELSEEVLKQGVNPLDVFTYPQYICSMNIDDWRYRRQLDGIVTTFFHVSFIGFLDDIQAGDDICEVRWFRKEELNEDLFEPEHMPLFQQLRVKIFNKK